MFKHFSLFKKKPTKPKERKPLNLPEVPADKFTPADIAEMINNGTPIWTWTSILDNFNVTAMLNMQGNCLDGFAMFRKEHDLLIKYVAVVCQDLQSMTMKITEICKCTNSNIIELYNTELKDAHKVYYDDLGLTEEVRYFVHDLEYEKIAAYLEKNRVMYVGEEHFIKNPDYQEPSEE